ncbi:O-linked N-acetylglucosamine transferase family protein [Coleofasciculus sp. E1-EBD-02]|uniref:O-linked N-acetylglucosamine transferase family protein n=1 Tax=Coleofasciculus sp. E1-EBD-02 TaxID=3068481 RepID=UPI0032F3452C
MDNFLANFEAKILENIALGNLDTALNLIMNFVFQLSYGKESIRVMANVFGSATLDKICQQIGAKALDAHKNTIKNKSNSNTQLVIYIVTDLYQIGGHTAVLEDLIKARPEKQHLILITDTFQSAERSLIENRFKLLDVKINWAPRSQALDKLRWLQYELSGNRPSQVFLLNHPHDAVAVAAVQPNIITKLIFYHHAAHLFSLGTHLSYAQHIDFQPGSFYNCRNNLGILNNVYLPLVVDNIHGRPLSSLLSEGKIRTCSSGSNIKFEGMPYRYSYTHEVPKILAVTGGVHIHIGQLSPYALITIEAGLRKWGILPERFVHIPWVKSIRMAMHEYRVDVYLDSFPMGGGRTVVEVMASGTPITVHNNYRSRQLCTTDIVYPEAFRWQKPDELYKYLQAVNYEKLATESILSRKHYENHHTPDIMRERLIKIESGEVTDLPNELDYYYKDDLQSFIDQNFNDVSKGIFSISQLDLKLNWQDFGDEHKIREQIAKQWLNLPSTHIENAYTSNLGKAHQTLLNSGINNEPLSDSEQTLLDELVVRISRGLDSEKTIQYILVTMLHCRADQLPLQYDLTHIPQWLLNDYVKYLLDSPSLFQEVGAVDNYYRYMQWCMDYLHLSIFRNPDLTIWRNVATEFRQVANFIPLYFNEANLKNIYVKRAEIIEFILKLNGYEIDYEFEHRLVTQKKIRLGILAARFNPSAETFASLPVYEYISRDFEVILYSLNQTGHPLENYCQSCANSFKSLPQNLRDQVNVIRADNLDILFIATNVTAVTNQICLLSMHRLARIQVTSGGSVVTTGMRHMDYYISGNLTDPLATAQQHYRETLIKLEGTAHCFSYGSEQKQATVQIDRGSLGISEETVIFISGANFFKIIPELIDTWIKIIAVVPNSALVLLPFGPNWSNAYPKKAFLNHLSHKFSEPGVGAERLIVLDPQPVPNREDVKEYYKISDIYLDSFPFSGTTSLIEPLEVGLPVIARQGTCFRSVMGAALLKSLDIPDLVADSEEAYIELAIALGTNPELRQRQSEQIKQKMQTTPPFLDSRAYSAKMGALFQNLFRKYLADTLSNNLRLRDINLIIFPDWSQQEELIAQDLANVIKAITTHPDQNRITLLIDIDNISEEDADLAISSIVMNLLMEEDLEVEEGPEISILGKLSDMQWEALLTRIQSRIVLENENQGAITQAKADKISAWELNSLSEKRAVQQETGDWVLQAE